MTEAGPGAWLAPVGALFGGAAAMRAWLYRCGFLQQARLAGPVISVGNLSVGGSGKTPVVARIAEILREEGLPVAILSRGYGGAHRGETLIVSDGEGVLASAAEAGDEPVMLARQLPGVVVAVGQHRVIVGRAVEARFGRRVHVLDDGFQHLRLARDLDIVCAEPADLADRPMPAGRLREFPSALRRADVLLVNAAAETILPFGALEVLRFGRRVDGFFDLDGRTAPTPTRPWLLSGIARPHRFAFDVASYVPALAGHAAFLDHHPFTEAEMHDVVRRARAAGADAVVTTAKDAVRLPTNGFDLPLLVLRISAVIEDEGRLRERLLAVARRAA